MHQILENVGNTEYSFPDPSVPCFNAEDYYRRSLGPPSSQQLVVISPLSPSQMAECMCSTVVAAVVVRPPSSSPPLRYASCSHQSPTSTPASTPRREPCLSDYSRPHQAVVSTTPRSEAFASSSALITKCQGLSSDKRSRGGIEEEEGDREEQI
jgi:hypothetical protein